MAKTNSFEFAIILLGGILVKLQEYVEQEPEPDFIQVTEIDYGPQPPPDIPEHRLVESLEIDPEQEEPIIPITPTSPSAPIRF